jgi:hemolysin III
VALTPEAAAAGLHLLGFALTLALGLRLRRAGAALLRPQRRAIAGFTLAWLALFGSSAAFHLARPGPWRDVLAVADEAAIVLAIAAAWTPLGPFRLPPLEMRRMLAVTWGSALLSLAVTAWAARDGEAQSARNLAYLLQALAPGLLYGRTILAGFSPGLLSLLFASAMFYGGGMLLYLRPELPWAHAGWHAAVLAGCLCNHAGLGHLIAEARRARAG